MTSCCISPLPPKCWQSACHTQQNLFHNQSWATVLEDGFGARTLYVTDGGDMFSVAVFRAGPFRVGYTGFPVGGTVAKGSLDADTVARLKRAAWPVPVHLLRIPVSAFGVSDDLPFRATRTRETAIEDLAAWRLEALSASVSRNVRKAERLGVQVHDVSDPELAGRLFGLYRDTVRRHRGGMRYTRAYFEALLRLAGTSTLLRCMTATVNDEVAGFLVVARSNSIVWYLHGATDMRFQDRRPADLLFARAITWARDEGMSVFDFMPSPAGQKSLIRYKEKWGGTTRDQMTYDVPIKTLPAGMFRLMSPVYRALTAGRG